MQRRHAEGREEVVKVRSQVCSCRRSNDGRFQTAHQVSLEIDLAWRFEHAQVQLFPSVRKVFDCSPIQTFFQTNTSEVMNASRTSRCAVLTSCAALLALLLEADCRTLLDGITNAMNVNSGECPPIMISFLKILEFKCHGFGRLPVSPNAETLLRFCLRSSKRTSAFIQALLPYFAGQQLPSQLIMAYYETWKWTTGELGSVAPYVGIVALAFIKPDTAYVSGSMSLSDLQFSGTDGNTIKGEVEKLQKAGQKVIPYTNCVQPSWPPFTMTMTFLCKMFKIFSDSHCLVDTSQLQY